VRVEPHPRILALKDYLAQQGEMELLSTVNDMDARGKQLRSQVATARHEPCHGYCWFLGGCPREIVCNN